MTGRYYDCCLEVKGRCVEKLVREIGNIFEDEWVKDTTPSIELNGIMMGGRSYLCGEEGEKEAHARIAKAVKNVVPNAKITTRWTYLEELPCTEYVTE